MCKNIEHSKICFSVVSGGKLPKSVLDAKGMYLMSTVTHGREQAR